MIAMPGEVTVSLLAKGAVRARQVWFRLPAEPELPQLHCHPFPIPVAGCPPCTPGPYTGVMGGWQKGLKWMAESLPAQKQWWLEVERGGGQITGFGPRSLSPSWEWHGVERMQRNLGNSLGSALNQLLTKPLPSLAPPLQSRASHSHPTCFSGFVKWWVWKHFLVYETILKWGILDVTSGHGVWGVPLLPFRPGCWWLVTVDPGHLHYLVIMMTKEC